MSSKKLHTFILQDYLLILLRYVADDFDLNSFLFIRYIFEITKIQLFVLYKMLLQLNRRMEFKIIINLKY